MKESIKKFRDEARKLEESDALQEARRKYVSPLCFECPWAVTLALRARNSLPVQCWGGRGVRGQERAPSLPVQL